MAGEVKYGNSLVSSRKDGVLTYAKYIKDLKSGKDLESLLEELRSSIPETDEDGRFPSYYIPDEFNNVFILDAWGESFNEPTQKGQYGYNTLTKKICYSKFEAKLQRFVWVNADSEIYSNTRLYINKTDNSIWRWNGSDMECLSNNIQLITPKDIDALF